MPSYYDLSQDYTAPGEADPDCFSVSPAWVLAVVRFQFPVSFDLKTMSQISKFPPHAVAAKPVMVIGSDCIQLQVSQSKATYLGGLTATLLPGSNYAARIKPSDWVLAWMVNDETQAATLREKIQQLKPVNGFNDGLKFVGRVQSCREMGMQSPNGSKTIRYSLLAHGFKEFESSLFYEPQLAENIELGTYLGRVIGEINTLREKEGEGISSNLAIPTLLDLLLGRGIDPNLGRGNNDPRLNATAGAAVHSKESPYAFILPQEVGQLLGKVKVSKPGGILAYADLLEILYGLQRYQASGSPLGPGQNRLTPEEAGQLFSPDGVRDLGSGNRKYTGHPLLGTFLLTQPQFTNTNVWSVLQQFLNPVINEMYTTLRVNNEGSVVPTLVVRQTPFSSTPDPKLVGTSEEVTPYLELPRWKLPAIITQSWDLGTSDAMRHNFVHVYGQSVMSTGDSVRNELIRNPPIRDDLDPKRNGLRPYMYTVACSEADIQNGGAGRWMKIIADIVMGQHMMITGTINMYGIQAPIAPGDNLEWDGVVYHIESLVHSCGIGPQGQKRFTTTINVTHGVRAEPDPQDELLGRYAFLDSDPVSDLHPGLSYEGIDSQTDDDIQVVEQ